MPSSNVAWKSPELTSQVLDFISQLCWKPSENNILIRTQHPPSPSFLCAPSPRLAPHFMIYTFTNLESLFLDAPSPSFFNCQPVHRLQIRSCLLPLSRPFMFLNPLTTSTSHVTNKKNPPCIPIKKLLVCLCDAALHVYFCLSRVTTLHKTLTRSQPYPYQEYLWACKSCQLARKHMFKRLQQCRRKKGKKIMPTPSHKLLNFAMLLPYQLHSDVPVRL